MLKLMVVVLMQGDKLNLSPEEEVDARVKMGII